MAKTWSQLFKDQVKNDKGYIKALKEIGEYTYTLQYRSSKCGTPDSTTEEGKKINKLRDERAAELKSIFDRLEPSPKNQPNAL